jgi:flagellar biosynthesis/type III secretory pathway protein FliH
MNEIKKAVYLILALILLFSTATSIVEHIKQETVERIRNPPSQPSALLSSGNENVPGNISINSGESTMTIQPYPYLLPDTSNQKDEDQNPSDQALDCDRIFENGYQEGYQAGYQAGYDQGRKDADQWMILKIQEYMTEIPSEGPKIKQVGTLQPSGGEAS